MLEVLLGVSLFTGIILLLVAIILAARFFLVPRGPVRILINDEEDRALQVSPGGKLLQTLGGQGIYIPSACGGGGSCGQCLVKVKDGGGAILPTETGHINRREEREGLRLAIGEEPRLGLVLAASAFNHVGRDRPRRAAEADERHAFRQRRHHTLDCFIDRR